MYSREDATEILWAVRRGEITQERYGQWWRPAHVYKGETVDDILKRLDWLDLIELGNTELPRITKRGLETLMALGPDGKLSLPLQLVRLTKRRYH